jgi:hypothetical protein
MPRLLRIDGGYAMQMNLFEGARRIARVLGVICAAIAGGFAWMANEPYVTLEYSIVTFGALPMLRPPVVGHSCDHSAGDEIEYVHRTSAAGRRVSVELCFKASKADSGEMLIPYQDAGDGKVWLADRSSPEVKAYVKQVGDRFSLTTVESEIADKWWSASQRSQIQWTVGTVIAALAAVWGIAKIIGWIARGFLGIPAGLDRRPTHDPDSEN